MLSFAATLCFFLLLKLLFSFFLMTFSVSTVQFSEFILFGGNQIILHFSRSLAIDSTCTLDARVLYNYILQDNLFKFFLTK